VTLPAAAAPLANAMTVGMSSTVSFDVRHNTNRTYYRIDFRLPTSSYTAQGGTGPAGWTVSTPDSQTVRFTAACNGTASLPRNSTRTFTVNVLPPNASAGTVTTDFDSTSFTVTASTLGSAPGCASTTRTTSGTRTVPLKVLSITGAGTALQQLAPPAVVIWTLSNQSDQTKSGATTSPSVAGQSCATTSLNPWPGSASLPNTRTVKCTYGAATAGSTYTVVTNATANPSPSTAVGASLAIDVGAAAVSWRNATLMRGQVRDALILDVVNASRATISKIEVTNASSGWAVISASTDRGLTWAQAPGSALNVVFTGTVAAGDTVRLIIHFSGMPAAGSYPFQVKATPSSGDDYAVTFGPQAVTVRAPAALPEDVSLLTVRSNADGQLLEWTNPASAHAGVVVFKAPGGTNPTPPVDYVDYTVAANRTAELVYASTDPSRSSATDPVAGAFNYLVCNHDVSFVYSACSLSDIARRPQYSGDSAVAPSGGWTVQLGGEALGNVQVYAGGRAAIRTNRGDLNVLNLADGSRPASPDGGTIAPALLGYALPATYTPAWRLFNGPLVAISADADGWVTAVNLETGAQHWRERKRDEVRGIWESFPAGVSGVASTGGLPPAYQDDRDVLFLGSAATGRLLAISAATGRTLWTVETNSTVSALTAYDAGTGSLWVPTAHGVQAWSLADSGPDTPATLTWSQDYGPHSTYCIRTAVATLMACVDNAGDLRILQKASGALVGDVVSTGAGLPSTLVRVSSGTPGFLVGNADGLVRVVPTTAGDASLTSLQVGPTWSPGEGWTLSSALIFAADRYLIVGATDPTAQGIHLYKRSSEDLSPISTSPDVVPGRIPTLVGPPAYDSAHGLYVFGTEEGRIWAIPSTSF